MEEHDGISRRPLLKGAAALLALGIAAPARATAANGRTDGTGAAFSPDALAALRATMERHVAEGYLPGAVWLLHRNGETHVGTAGTFELGGGQPMARDTIFRVASITKPVTAAIAMKLVEDGVIGLDDPVDPLLPELAAPRVLASIEAELEDTVPAKRPVTLRHLLTQTFGLGAIMVFPERYPIQAAMREAGLAPSWTLPKMSSDEYMKRLGALPLAYQPGERFLYNNGLDVAGILVERATGKRLADVLREWLFEPLGMEDTGFFVPPEKQHRLPTQYGPDFAAGDGSLIVYDADLGIDFTTPPPMDSGAGGLVTTVDDYAAFTRMMLNAGELGGIRILRPETVAEMTRNQLTEAQRRTSDAALFMEDGGASWGLGMSVAVHRTKPWLTPGAFGWNGGYGTTAYTDPTNGLTAMFFSQRMMDSPEPPKTYVDFWTQVYKALV
ncbi:serine hydrolase domain-containing protein [Chelativorans intermedius]|uniref:Serine hydrolase domain-containing protein n=1 Tax=Chelativorans intermedius TaxID=515947 RepID=A0ABV6D989_9HYPH|nr:serine hydrolase domain-containing protein [Chelativorans intermedius]MCT8999978.1 beta-lactamase family protein [Chelativorans intermedius]